MSSDQKTSREILEALGFLGRLGVQGVVHFTGLMGVALGVLWLSLGTAHLKWIFWAHREFGGSGEFLGEIGIHLGLSAALWTMLYLSCLAIRTRQGSSRAMRVVKRARGTVITETIIIMPVLLLLLLGLSQLAVLNIAGMLMNYGASQAVRAVWVWAPELEPLNNQTARRGVTEDLVRDRARIQAALAVAPVAPADFRATGAEASEDFMKMRGAILAGQALRPPNDAGRVSIDEAHGRYQFTGSEERTFYRAFDSTNFVDRSVRKFTFAYQALDVELILEDEEVGAVVTYQQKIMFPFITNVFGTPGSVAGLPGHYTAIRREFIQSAQVAPNAELPTR